jgi:dimethylaniline monooxygenase (N-oxide forming)
MRITIIGAGFAGLSSAKVLRQFGHDVTIYEKAPDVGGVWSATRRYPGLKTQNNKQTYYLSDHRMPREYPQWLSGEQVQAYLESYATRFGLTSCLRLSTEVTAARPAPEGGWLVTASSATEHYDHLVVANGIFSDPFIPEYDGADVFTDAGGGLITTGDLRSPDQAAGKHVVIVGYGKSSCDVAAEVAKCAASTTVIARSLLWKVPRMLGGMLNYKYLLLTRLGEALFPYQYLRGPERLLHAGGSKLADTMIASVGRVVTRQLRLEDLGLVPHGPFKSIARASVSSTTEGFYEAVGDGTISVRREQTIARLLEKDGMPRAQLADGTVIPADLVICGTGWRQSVPFFDSSIQRKLTDERGNFQLYRQILPVDVPNLTFAGYNSSFFCPLSAEMSAVWIASYLAGHHQVPPAAEMRRFVRDRVDWMELRTGGHSARGTNIVPFSMHNIDETLDEIGLNVSKATKAMQWLLPVRPSSYRKVATKLAKRLHPSHWPPAG